MLKKIFHFDTETTGLEPNENDIIQLAFIIEINGKIEEEFSFDVQPFNWENINQDALSVNKKTIEILKGYPPPSDVYQQLIRILSVYIDKYDRNDKFQPAGYNVRFDIDFFKSFFQKNGDSFFGSYFNYKAIDPLAVLYFLDGLGFINLPNYKLETVCEYFGIQIDAHDALSDIKANKKLIDTLTLKFRKGLNHGKAKYTNPEKSGSDH